MNIDSILKFFVPKNDSFFPIFEDNAQVLVSAAEQLKLLIGSTEPEARAGISGRIKELDKVGDEVALKTYTQLNISFVTPFDREDIIELARNLKDVIHSINHISKSVRIYHPVRLDNLYSDLAEMIYQTTLGIDRCLGFLRDAGNNKDLILKCCNEQGSMEEYVKETFYSGIESMLEKEKDITELIKNKDILENFEKCVNEAAKVSSTLKSILLKIK